MPFMRQHNDPIFADPLPNWAWVRYRVAYFMLDVGTAIGCFLFVLFLPLMWGVAEAAGRGYFTAQIFLVFIWAWFCFCICLWFPGLSTLLDSRGNYISPSNYRLMQSKLLFAFQTVFGVGLFLVPFLF